MKDKMKSHLSRVKKNIMLNASSHRRRNGAGYLLRQHFLQQPSNRGGSHPAASFFGVPAQSGREDSWVWKGLKWIGYIATAGFVRKPFFNLLKGFEYVCCAGKIAAKQGLRNTKSQLGLVGWGFLLVVATPLHFMSNSISQIGREVTNGVRKLLRINAVPEKNENFIRSVPQSTDNLERQSSEGEPATSPAKKESKIGEDGCRKIEQKATPTQVAVTFYERDSKQASIDSTQASDFQQNSHTGICRSLSGSIPIIKPVPAPSPESTPNSWPFASAGISALSRSQPKSAEPPKLSSRAVLRATPPDIASTQSEKYYRSSTPDHEIEPFQEDYVAEVASNNHQPQDKAATPESKGRGPAQSRVKRALLTTYPANCQIDHESEDESEVSDVCGRPINTPELPKPEHILTPSPF